LSLALLVLGSVVANPETYSVNFKSSVGEMKDARMMDRSINMRSSNKNKGAWSYLTEYVYGEQNSKTEFNYKIEAHTARLTREHSKKMRQNKNLRAARIDHDINWAVVMPMFLGEIRVGSKKTIVDVVFDTGSDWLVVPDSNCTNCDGETINNEFAEQTSFELTERLYGSASLAGYTFKDRVCLTSSSNSCIEEFEYFAFTNQTGINDPIEGILGMSQNKQMILSVEEV
jgi:hypothetical protein